jgi:hypothetical protein
LGWDKLLSGIFPACSVLAVELSTYPLWFIFEFSCACAGNIPFRLVIMALTGTIVHIAAGVFSHGVRRTIALAIGVLLEAQLGSVPFPSRSWDLDYARLSQLLWRSLAFEFSYGFGFR